VRGCGAEPGVGRKSSFLLHFAAFKLSENYFKIGFKALFACF
jgi:hypothetical protein